MAAPTLQAEGTLNVVTSGDNTPTIPTHQADDILIVAVGLYAPNTGVETFTGTTPATWTKVHEAIGATVGNYDMWIAYFWKRATGAGTTVTVVRPTGADTGTDTAFGARAYVIRGCATSGDPWDAAAASPAAPNWHTAANQAVAALTVSGTERTAIHFLVRTDDYGTAPTLTGWTTGTQVESTSGTDHSQASHRKDNISASTTADTATVEAPAAGGYVFWGASFKPPVAVAARVPYVSPLPQLLAH